MNKVTEWKMGSRPRKIAILTPLSVLRIYCVVLLLILVTYTNGDEPVLQPLSLL